MAFAPAADFLLGGLHKPPPDPSLILGIDTGAIRAVVVGIVDQLVIDGEELAVG